MPQAVRHGSDVVGAGSPLPDHPQPAHIKYRPDIDGLRAIAVLSVVAFHAFPKWMKGGFIGVDVFFVISGFLISTTIFEALERGSFSFADFYARRIRRIFPALIAVLLACFAFGLFALLPDEQRQLDKHIAAGAAFISNFVLWTEAGYFDSAADTKPLLHLWSLGIEEQYYIVWPAVLWFAWKIKPSVPIVIAGLALVSFFLCVIGIAVDPVTTFYWPQTRAWELLAGSLLAWVILYEARQPAGLITRCDGWLASKIWAKARQSHDAPLTNILPVLGLALLIYGFGRLNKSMDFPGVWAAAPVVGAVLIISAGAQAWVNRTILSNRIFVWFGLISYPLYLWHWPLLSFARIIEGEVPNRQIRIAAVALSIALAWLTYAVIERPLRSGGGRRGKVVGLALAMFVLGVTGYEGYRRAVENIQQRPDPVLAETKNNCDRYFPDWSSITDNPCRLQRPSGNSIAIVGDSHAAHLFSGMSAVVGPTDGVAVFPASCAAPFIDVATAQKDAKWRNIRGNAYTLINRAYDYIVNDASIRTVVLAHNPGCSYDDAIDVRNPHDEDYQQVLMDGMRRTLSALVSAHKQVIVLLDNPTLPFDPTICADRPFRISNDTMRCSFPRSEYDRMPGVSEYRSLVGTVLKDFPSVQAVDLTALFCDAGICRLSIDGHLMYADRSHFSPEGSKYAAAYILKAAKASR